VIVKTTGAFLMCYGTRTGPKLVIKQQIHVNVKKLQFIQNVNGE